MKCAVIIGVLLVPALASASLGAEPSRPDGTWEITPDSEKALKRGLDWLVQNQGGGGNWESDDLGLVSMGALAFLSAGYRDGMGPNGKACDKALQYVIRNARPSGLLNISAQPNTDMYNHGLSTFVLGQAHGMVNDTRINAVLDRALKLIVATQCRDGGWGYAAKSLDHGNDLSLAVMQAKALRSAVDSGLEVPTEVINQAIRGVRQHYAPKGMAYTAPEADQQKVPGQFVYRFGSGPSTAMAAAGVVCLQEFGQYDDWRIPKSMDVVTAAIAKLPPNTHHNGVLPFDDPYTLYYVGQALYQVGGQRWVDNYPRLRDYLVATQLSDGSWREGRRTGRPGKLYSTAVACFILAIPNRYLPILQEGKIEGIRSKYQVK
jgi:hypothetical protein